MSAAAMVLVCALDLLGRSEGALPPIRIVDAPPQGVSGNADAFVTRPDGVIYLIASAPAFSVALSAQQVPRTRGSCSERAALKMIASIIAHEVWHVEHGSDERGAYQAQLTELNRLGLGPGSWATYSVTRAMQSVLAVQSRRASEPDRAFASLR